MSSDRAAAFQDRATPLRPTFVTPPTRGVHKQASICTKTQPSTALSDKHGTGQAVGRLATITRNSSIKKTLTSYMSNAEGGVSFTESLDFLKLSITSNSASSVDSPSEFETLAEPSEVHCNDPPQSGEEEEKLTAGAGASEDGGLGPVSNFRPLLLFIPLRLGQDSFNMEYAVALKVHKVIILEGQRLQLRDMRESNRGRGRGRGRERERERKRERERERENFVSIDLCFI